MSKLGRKIPKLSSYFEESQGEYILKMPFKEFPQGSNWKIFKTEHLSEIMRSLLSSKILKAIFPNAIHYDSFLVKDSNDQIVFVSRIDNSLTPYDVYDCKSMGVKFNQLIDKTNNKMKIQNFEKSLLARLFVDGEYSRCSDYSLGMTSDTEAQVFLTNISYNFQSLGVREDKGYRLLSEKLGQQYYILEQRIGAEKTIEIIKQVQSFESNLFLKLFKIIPTNFANKLNSESIIASAENIISSDDKLRQAVHTALYELRAAFDEKMISESLSLDNAILPLFRGLKVTSENVESYLTSLMGENIANLRNLKACVKVETSIRNNDVNQLSELLKDEVVRTDPLCISFYKYPTTNMYIDVYQLHLSKMASYYQYENDASEVFNEFWNCTESFAGYHLDNNC